MSSLSLIALSSSLLLMVILEGAGVDCSVDAVEDASVLETPTVCPVVFASSPSLSLSSLLLFILAESSFSLESEASELELPSLKSR